MIIKANKEVVEEDVEEMREKKGIPPNPMYLLYTSSIKWQFDSIKEDTSGRITPKGTMLYVHLSI